MDAIRTLFTVVIWETSVFPYRSPSVTLITEPSAAAPTLRYQAI